MDQEDRISSLPDHLLLDIISRIQTEICRFYPEKEEERLMSTKELIRKTCTISKRWHHLWTLLPNLIFIDDYGSGFYTDQTKYFFLIEKTLTQCPTDVKLNKFKLHILYDSNFNTIPTLQVNSWILHAIKRNVQEVDLKIQDRCTNSDYGGQFCYDNERFFNNSCIMSMRISDCLFNPPNGAIRWDKLKSLCISKGELDSDIVGKILSGSPCLETLELSNCEVVRRNLKSLFENFVVIRLSCEIETYKRFSYDHYDNEYMSMKLLRCQFNPTNLAIRWDNLKCLCISDGELDENLIRKIFSGSPCLEILELDGCYGVRRIDISSKRFKDLVLTNYGDQCPGEDYIHTMEIHAPYILSLTIKRYLYLDKLLLLDMSSLVKVDLDYLVSYHFADKRGRHELDIREEMLRGLLPSLGHVNEITLGDDCFEDLSRVIDKGSQIFRGRGDTSHSSHSFHSDLVEIIENRVGRNVGADAYEDRITELFASESKKRADAAAAKAKRSEESERKIHLMQMQKQRQRQEKKLDKGISDDDMGLISLFD